MLLLEIHVCSFFVQYRQSTFPPIPATTADALGQKPTWLFDVVPNSLVQTHWPPVGKLYLAFARIVQTHWPHRRETEMASFSVDHFSFIFPKTFDKQPDLCFDLSSIVSPLSCCSLDIMEDSNNPILLNEDVLVGQESQNNIALDEDDVHSAGSDGLDGLAGLDAPVDDGNIQDLVEQGSTTSRLSTFTRIGNSLTSAIKMGAAVVVRAAFTRRVLVQPNHVKSYDVESKTFNILIGSPGVVLTNIITHNPAKKVKAKKNIKRLRTLERAEEKNLQTLLDDERKLDTLKAKTKIKIKNQKQSIKRITETVEWEEKKVVQLDDEFMMAYDINNDLVPFYGSARPQRAWIRMRSGRKRNATFCVLWVGSSIAANGWRVPFALKRSEMHNTCSNLVVVWVPIIVTRNRIGLTRNT